MVLRREEWRNPRLEYLGNQITNADCRRLPSLHMETLLVLLNSFFNYFKKPHWELVVSFNCSSSALGIWRERREEWLPVWPWPIHTCLSTPYCKDAFVLPWKNTTNAVPIFSVWRNTIILSGCGERVREELKGSTLISLNSCRACLSIAPGCHHSQRHQSMTASSLPIQSKEFIFFQFLSLVKFLHGWFWGRGVNSLY